MKNVERVLRTINHEIPDRVPKGELLIDKGFIGSFLGKKNWEQVSFYDEIDFLEALGMDLISLQPRAILKDGRDPWGRKIDPKTKIWEVTIEEEKQLEAYQPPNIEEFEFKEISRWASETDYFIFGVVSGGFDLTSSLLDFMNFLTLTKRNPGLIESTMEKFTKFNTQLAKAAVEAGAHGIIIGDDIAYNQGTFLNPKALRKLLFPYLKKQVEEIKKLKIPVFFHADGDLNAVLGDIVEMGFDGLHSLQPSSGMDIGKIKIAYGDKLCLMGNMDLDYLVPLGSEGEIEEGVKATMEAAKKGGGYIFGTCGALSEGLPINNVKLLFDAGTKYGGY